MKNRFQSEIDARLSGLTFEGEAEVLDRIHARRLARPIPKRTVILVLALMLTLCGTAVALTLRYSARFDLVRHARGAVSTKYGLTGEMLDLFGASVERDGEKWTVRFTSGDWLKQMGEYTVTGRSDGSAEATWSHDGAAPSESVWGAEALQRFLDAKRAQQQAAIGAWEGDYPSLEEQAAIDEPLLALKGVDWRVSVVPGEGDLQPEEADRLARQAVRDRYGVTDAALDDYRTGMYFYMSTGTGARHYRVHLTSGAVKEFVVELSSPEGEILICSSMRGAGLSLPEGDLSLYPEAAEEYVRRGAFGALSPAEKAAVYRRYEAAGLTGLLPANEYVTPAAADLNEQDAIARAKEAIMAAYDFPEAGFELFRVQTAMLRQGDGREWQVRFLGESSKRHMWLTGDMLGDYTATVSADGTVTGCEWSLEALGGGPMSESWLGQSEAFSGQMLPSVLRLRDRLDAVLAAHPGDGYVDATEMTLAESAAYDGLMRQAGFHPAIYSHMLPEAGELTEEEALAQARQVLIDEYALTDAAIDGAFRIVSFRMRYDLGDEPVKGWDIMWQIWNEGNLDIYTVFLNAADGVVEQVVHDDGALGNG